MFEQDGTTLHVKFVLALEALNEEQPPHPPYHFGAFLSCTCLLILPVLTWLVMENTKTVFYTDCGIEESGI